METTSSLLLFLCVLLTADFSLSDTDTNEKLDISTLKLVHALFRHGDRSPMRTYTTDLVPESHWEQGYGQLTKKGIQQEYSLGQYLRHTYINSTGFMDEEYNRTQLYARSTDVDRTLMSGQAVLTGLYPLPSEKYWNPHLSTWQPIPVHTVPVEDDYLLMGPDCPVYNSKLAEFQDASDELKKINDTNEDLYKYVGQNIVAEPTWGNVNNILDPIFVETDNGLTLPSWINSSTLDGLMSLHNHSFYTVTIPQPLVYFRGGVLMKEILQHMKQTVTGNNTSQKMKLYSAHDTTVVTLLKMLQVFNGLTPGYSTMVLVELHQLEKDQFAVQIQLRNDTSKPPYLLKIPGCDMVCPYERFKEIMGPFIPDDIKKLCGQSQTADPVKQSRIKEVETGVFVLASLLLLVVLVGVALYCLKQKRKENHEYSMVPLEVTTG